MGKGYHFWGHLEIPLKYVWISMQHRSHEWLLPMLPSFSRMRSEGFPFIVRVWGWTCVRFVFVVSSSPRRRCVVNSLPLGRAFGGVLEEFL